MKRLHKGFSEYSERKPLSIGNRKDISVVIVFRNESKNLPVLLQSLDAQYYPSENFDIVFCDDSSEDDSVKLIQAWQAESLLKSVLVYGETPGKKACQNLAILASNNELIACTDADCVLPPSWLQSISAAFSDAEISLAFGPVIFLEKNKKMQSLEFLSLIGSTMAMLELGWPVMGNAANMAFKKSAYLKVFPALNALKSASGDDVFFLHELSKENKEVGVLKGKEAIVQTKAQDSLGAFVQQRMRWASKASRYTSSSAIAVAALVFAINASLLGLFVSSFFWDGILSYFLLLFFVKGLLDYFLLKKYSRYFEQRFFPASFLFLEILNPIYIVGVALLSQMVRFNWKGRKY